MTSLGAFIRAYREFKKEHKDEMTRQRQLHMLAKSPLNYQLLENFIVSFVEKKDRDLIIELKGADFTCKMYWDNDAFKRVTSTTEQILSQQLGV